MTVLSPIVWDYCKKEVGRFLLSGLLLGITPESSNAAPLDVSDWLRALPEGEGAFNGTFPLSAQKRIPYYKSAVEDLCFNIKKAKPLGSYRDEFIVLILSGIYKQSFDSIKMIAAKCGVSGADVIVEEIQKIEQQALPMKLSDGTIVSRDHIFTSNQVEFLQQGTVARTVELRAQMYPTQQAFIRAAKAKNVRGITQGGVSYAEKGTYQLNITRLYADAAVLEVPIGELLIFDSKRYMTMEQSSIELTVAYLLSSICDDAPPQPREEILERSVNGAASKQWSSDDIFTVGEESLYRNLLWKQVDWLVKHHSRGPRLVKSARGRISEWLYSIQNRDVKLPRLVKFSEELDIPLWKLLTVKRIKPQEISPAECISEEAKSLTVAEEKPSAATLPAELAEPAVVNATSIEAATAPETVSTTNESPGSIPASEIGYALEKWQRRNEVSYKYFIDQLAAQGVIIEIPELLRIHDGREMVSQDLVQGILTVTQFASVEALKASMAKNR